jgi:hypothetical protein
MAISNTTIQIKKSVVSGNTPSSLANGEIAINSADGKLFYRTPSGSIAYIQNAQSFATVNANSSLILATSGTDTLSFVAGNNVTISANTTSKTITINSTTTAVANLVPSNYICQLVMGGNQTIPTGTDTLVTFNSVDFDPQAWANTSSYQIVPKVAGYYQVTGSVDMPQMAYNGQTNLQLRKNGNSFTITQAPAANNASAISLMASKVVYLNGTTDYITATVWHGLGSNITLASGNGNWLTATLVAYGQPGANGTNGSNGTFSGNTTQQIITTNTTSSTSNTTGALIVYGGAGIQGNLYVTNAYVNNNQVATIPDVLALAIALG